MTLKWKTTCYRVNQKKNSTYNEHLSEKYLHARIQSWCFSAEIASFSSSMKTLTSCVRKCNGTWEYLLLSLSSCIQKTLPGHMKSLRVLPWGLATHCNRTANIQYSSYSLILLSLFKDGHTRTDKRQTKYCLWANLHILKIFFWRPKIDFQEPSSYTTSMTH